MSLKHGLLGLLDYFPMTGYDLNKAFKDSLAFFWQAQTSQIYRELNTMESLGWVSFDVIIQTDKPNKKLYTLTPLGKEELERWKREDCLKDEMTVRSLFLMKLFFSGNLASEENLRTLENYLAIYEEKLKALLQNQSISKYEELVPDPNQSLYWSLTQSYGKYYYEMCIHWAKDSISLIKEHMK